MNPKIVAFVALLVLVSGGTFWATREYDESHSPTADIVNGGA